MKNLFRKFKQISILILAIAFMGCEEDDATLPTVTAGFTYTLSDAGVATFINISENANKYTWSFGDQDGNTSSLIDPVFTYDVGAYTVKLTASNVSGASDIFEDIIMILDQDVPLIALIGDATINVTLGDTFTDPGATALDEVDGDITASIVVGGDTVDTNTEGTYTITYDVSDAQGNAAIQVERTVNVSAIACDPEIAENIDPANGDINWTFLTNDITHTFESFGGTEASIVSNPLIDGINTSCNVQQFIKSDPCETWSGMGTELATALDFTARTNNVFKMKVLAETQITDVTLRLERLPFPDADPAVEKVASITATGEWQELTFDFSDVSTGTYKSMIIYFERDATCDGDIYYFDDIVQTSEASVGGGGENVILNFENNLTGIGLDAFESAGELLANPVSGGINTSPNVYAITYGVANQWWGGVGFVVGADALSDADAEYKVKLYSTVAPINVLFEVEQNGVGGNVGNTQEITTANEWVEVTFTLQGGAGIDRVLVRPAVGDASGTKTHDGILYVDDIVSIEGTPPTDCPAAPAGELLSNGSFEADNGAGTCLQVNSNDNGGVAEISSADVNSGTYSGHLITGEAQFPNFKWERFAPTTTGNVTIEVSFKYKFTTALGVGSIFQVLAFSEFAAGAQEHNMGNATDMPLNTWNTFTGTFVTHPDIVEGLSLVLQLTGSGNAGGAGEVFIDDVQVTQL